MKFTKLLKKIEVFFEKDADAVDEKKENDLKQSLEEKILSTKEKIKKSVSKSKTQKLKHKLRVLEGLKAKIELDK